jgi:general secretion pathway protein K
MVRRTSDEGFAIVIVLAVLALLALVAIVLQKSVAADVRAAATFAQRTRAEALADGLTRLTIRHLAVNTPAGNRSGLIVLDGEPTGCRTGAGPASIAVINVDGLINLNLSSEGLLTRVLTGIGLGDGEAAGLAKNIIDFRSAGDDSLSGGDKRALYEQAGLRHGPKNGPFESVGELDQVPGITPALLEKIRPLVTAHSRFGAINTGVMSLPVAMALSGGQTTLPLDILRTQIQLPIEFTYVPRSRNTGSTSSNTYLVRVTVGQSGAARFTRSAIVELKPSTVSGAAIKEWTEWPSHPAHASGPEPADLPTCIGGVLSLDPA